VAALVLPRSEVRVDGVSLNPARIGFLDVLRSMGADLEVTVEAAQPEPVGSIVARSSALHGVDVAPAAVPGLIDEVPALCVAAAHAQGRFTVSGAGELRLKESDRIAALAEGLGRMGARVEERPDGLVVEAKTGLRGAAVRAQDDHRIAMALAVAGLTATGVTVIEGAECAAVSFPEFYDVLAQGRSGG
jgi:3-phosphoshikimate 1-carboxyvinyltransferase